MATAIRSHFDMKQLHEYATPETDAFIESLIDQRGMNNAVYTKEITGKCHDLEQRLAACRDALRNVSKSSSSTRLQRVARETLTLTAPK